MMQNTINRHSNRNDLINLVGPNNPNIPNKADHDTKDNAHRGCDAKHWRGKNHTLLAETVINFQIYVEGCMNLGRTEVQVLGDIHFVVFVQKNGPRTDGRIYLLK
jgi:hypothetical protein